MDADERGVRDLLTYRWTERDPWRTPIHVRTAWTRDGHHRAGIWLPLALARPSSRIHRTRRPHERGGHSTSYGAAQQLRNDARLYRWPTSVMQQFKPYSWQLNARRMTPQRGSEKNLSGVCRRTATSSPAAALTMPVAICPAPAGELRLKRSLEGDDAPPHCFGLVRANRRLAGAWSWLEANVRGR
jgi:hypothetical protein